MGYNVPVKIQKEGIIMDADAFLDAFLKLGESGVGIAQLITMLFPGSWWASGILYVIGMMLSALTGGTPLA